MAENPWDPDKVRRYAFRARELGGHTHVAVWAGTATIDRRPDGTPTGNLLGGQRAKCGDVTFRNDEWAVLRRLLEEGCAGAQAWARVEVEIIEEDETAEGVPGGS